jgi:hypothetical protein
MAKPSLVTLRRLSAAVDTAHLGYPDALKSLLAFIDP